MKRLVFALLLAVSVASWTAAGSASAAPPPEPSDRWSHLRDFRDDNSYNQTLAQSNSALRDQAAAVTPSHFYPEQSRRAGEGGPSLSSDVSVSPLSNSTVLPSRPLAAAPAEPPANFVGPWLPQLAARINLDFDAVTLTNALSFLADSSGAAIAVDPRLKTDTGKTADEEQVTLHIKAATLQQALDLVVPAEMGWRVVDGQILVSSRERANPVFLHCYAIRDRISTVPDFGDSAPRFDLSAAMSAGSGGSGGGGGGGGLFQTSTKEDAGEAHPEQKIIALIKKFVPAGDPRIAAWDDAGGTATIDYFHGLLLVNQTAAGHRKIIALLSKL